MTPEAERTLLSVSHGSVFGGAHNQMLRLHAPLLERGWRTIVALPDEPGNAAERLERAGIEVIRIPLRRLRATANPSVQARFLGSLRRDVRTLRDLIQRHSVDLVQVHGPTNPQAALAARVEHVPVVWQLLDTRAPMILRHTAMPLVARLADVVMTTGLAVADAHPGARRLGDRLVVYFPPVDTRAFSNDRGARVRARRELGIPDGTLAIGSVGNLNPQKGHDWLLRAVALMRASGVDAYVRILGAPSTAHRGAEERLRAEAARLGLEGAFEIVDPGTRVPELLPALDVFVLSSVPRSEGMPTVILEAMACGLPVVSTDVGAVREVVSAGETGFVVPPEDAEALASGICTLVGDPSLRSSMGSAGRRRVVERFDIDRCVETHLRAYELAVARRESRREGVHGRPVRVVFINHTSRLSGAEASLLSSLSGLPQYAAVSLACPDGPLAEAARRAGVPRAPIGQIDASLRLHPWYTSKAVGTMLHTGLVVRRLAGSLAADVLHANSIRAGLAAMLAGRLGGPPVVVSVHDCLPATFPAELTRRLLAGSSATIVANSRYTAENLEGVRRGGAIRVVYPPVDLERFDPNRIDRTAVRAELGIEDEAPALGVVAQLTPWKGQDTALEALVRLRGRWPDARLFLVGEAKFVSKATRYDNQGYVRALHKMVDELGIGRAVAFLGQRDDVPEIMRALDLLLVPSWEEPFGMVVIEAMALGTPVLATEVGGPAEIIEDGRNGRLVPPGRPELWAKAAEDLLSDSALLERMGEEGRRTAREFGSERYVTSMVATYREVLN